MTALEKTAIHEAGHAVAHIRLGIQQTHVSIIADEEKGTMGSAYAEGVENVWTAATAADQVQAYCAGYAALVGAGYSDDVAHLGDDDDMDKAQYLIDFWGLGGTLDQWQAKTIELMCSDENVRAVQFVAESLIQYQRLPEEYVSALVDLADGEITSDEWDRFVNLQYPEFGRARLGADT